jgi:hypothetical protein
VKELIEQARKIPGRFAAAAPASAASRITTWRSSPSALAWKNHIPNKTGAAGMINDLVVGDAQVAVLNAASSAADMNQGWQTGRSR